jgi:hypothetical protein
MRPRHIPLFIILAILVLVMIRLFNEVAGPGPYYDRVHERYVQ